METFKIYYYGLPSWLRQWIICLQCRRPGFDPWVGKIPWRRKWLPTPAFLPGEFHGQRSLVGYSPWGHKELDMLEWLSTYAHTILITLFWYFFVFRHTRSLKAGSNPPILYSKGLHWNVGCARPHLPLNHLQFTLCASDHLLSPIIVIYETVLSVLQDVSLISNSRSPTSTPW